MHKELFHNLLLNIARGYKSLSQGMVGGLAWGLSYPFLSGKPITYNAKDVANTLMLANLVGIAGYAVGDAVEYAAHKAFPLPLVGLDRIKDTIRKHPIATIAAIGTIGIQAVELQRHMRKKHMQDNTKLQKSYNKGVIWSR